MTALVQHLHRDNAGLREHIRRLLNDRESLALELAATRADLATERDKNKYLALELSYARAELAQHQ